MSRDRTYGFAIVGAGVIGRIHGTVINALPNARLEAVVDVIPDRAETLAAEAGAVAFTELDDVLAMPAVEIISVCVPSGLHAEIGVRAARAGKHLVVEKPIDVSLAAADRLIDACHTAGVKLTVISQRRFDDSFRSVHDRILQHGLGDLILASAKLKWYRSQEYYDSGDWRGTWDLDGGGVLMNQGVHYIDLLRWMLGPVESIAAVCATKGHTGIEVEDIALAIIRFSSGALASIDASTAVFPGLPERLELTGTEGTAVIEAGVLTLFVTRDSKAPPTPVADADQLTAAADPTSVATSGHASQLADFLAAIETEREPSVTGEDGRAAIEVILGVYEAARRGVEVRLPLSPASRAGLLQ